jgi:hypothetical protein
MYIREKSEHESHVDYKGHGDIPNLDTTMIGVEKESDHNDIVLTKSMLPSASWHGGWWRFGVVGDYRPIQQGPFRVW